MSNEVRLDEQSTSRQEVKLYDGTLHHTNIRFQFKGNHPDHDAWADVQYWGR
ncbi:MAG: hypothetical protein LRY71_06070 [Bacillaceae bacterium]|nr:hypothetical protein [Bacillaceae bacterium]